MKYYLKLQSHNIGLYSMIDEIVNSTPRCETMPSTRKRRTRPGLILNRDDLVNPVK